MYSPRLVKEVLKALGKQLVDDGRLDSVSLYAAGPTADFLQLDAQEWQDDEYDQQGNLLNPIKVKGGTREDIDWGLKQKLFDYVPEKRMRGTARPTFLTEMGSEEQGREGRCTTGCERDQESQISRRVARTEKICFLQCHQWRLKALVSHVMTERVGRSGRKFGACTVRRVKSTLFTVCVNAMFTWSLPQTDIVLD